MKKLKMSKDCIYCELLGMFRDEDKDWQYINGCIIEGD